jgi:hypothetical protein
MFMNCSLLTLSHTILEEHDMDIGNDDGGDVRAVDSSPTSVNTRYAVLLTGIGIML